jgi:hypothetical protein
MTESPQKEFKNSGADWALRGFAFALFFFFSGWKFTSDFNKHWIQLYEEIGFGQWLRYVTGAMEFAGAFLTLYPQTVTAGLSLLGTTMLGAFLIDVIVLHRFADSFVPGSIFCALLALWLRRRRG